MDSPIKRMGGKKLLRKIIVERIPVHDCYVEPFFGAGWVYFYKKPSKIEVINDIDDDIVNFFEVIKCKHDEFMKEIKFNLYSRTLFYRYKNADKKSLSDVKRAVRFWYLIQYSFGAKCASYGYNIVKRKKPCNFNMQSRIKQVYSRLQDTNIENKSFDDIILRYDRDTTFFYLDPPYFCKTGYSHDFGCDEHKKLARLLSCLKGKFLLTINDCDEARQLYGRFFIEKVNNMWSIDRGNKKACELLVTNY